MLELPFLSLTYDRLSLYGCLTWVIVSKMAGKQEHILVMTLIAIYKSENSEIQVNLQTNLIKPTSKTSYWVTSCK